MDSSILREFGILYRTYKNYFSMLAQKEGLSFSDGVFLCTIGNSTIKSEEKTIRQEEICRTLVINKAAVARSVKIMEERKLLFIKNSKEDRRAKDLSLTKSGKTLFNKLTKVNDIWLKEIFSDFSLEEIEIFYKMISMVSLKAINK